MLNKNALDLFLTFGKIGTFTFGGGYAMIPLIQKEVVETKQWITNDDVLEILAIAESTPGPIAINAATFVGYRVAGTFGAFCATMGVVLPSFFITLWQGTLLSLQAAIALPTILLRRGLPVLAATSPYVVTKPAGTCFTIS